MGNAAYRALSLAFSLAVLVSGCGSLDPKIHPILPEPEQRAMVEPWPVKVGVYVAPAATTLQYGKGWVKTPAGETIDSTFRWGLAQLFAETVPLGAPPDRTPPPAGLAGSIELAEVRIREGNKADVLGTLPITYVLRFHGPGGAPEGSLEIAGKPLNFDTKRTGTGLLFMSGEDEMKLVIRDQTALMMLGVARAEQVRHWLAQAGVTAHTLRPSPATPVATAFPENSLVILPDVEHWQHTDNARPIGCIGPPLQSMQPVIAVASVDERTRMQFFPWLEPATAPLGMAALNTFLATPEVRARFRALGIRYLLAYEGGTETDFGSGGIACGAGMGGGGCFGVAWGERVSEFKVQLFDLAAAETPAEFHVRKSGGTFMPAFILPIPIIPATEGIACEALARQIHAHFYPPQTPPQRE